MALQELALTPSEYKLAGRMFYKVMQGESSSRSNDQLNKQIIWALLIKCPDIKIVSAAYSAIRSKPVNPETRQIKGMLECALKSRTAERTISSAIESGSAATEATATYICDHIISIAHESSESKDYHRIIGFYGRKISKLLKLDSMNQAHSGGQGPGASIMCSVLEKIAKNQILTAQASVQLLGDLFSEIDNRTPPRINAVPTTLTELLPLCFAFADIKHCAIDRIQKSFDRKYNEIVTATVKCANEEITYLSNGATLCSNKKATEAVAVYKRLSSVRAIESNEGELANSMSQLSILTEIINHRLNPRRLD